jgi:membrane protein YqaA with SNARE-associated domain
VTEAPGLAPFAAIAAEPLTWLVLVAWGFAEAIVAPVVPDVLIGILVLAAPWQLGPLLSAAILGGVGGAAAFWRLRRRRPEIIERFLAIQPGLGRPGLAEAEERLRRRGVLAGFAQVGPGLPLKAYLAALATIDPERPVVEVAALAAINRLARLAPVAVAFALLHPVAVAADWGAPTIAAVYIAGWALFYAAYWTRRDPRRRG